MDGISLLKKNAGNIITSIMVFIGFLIVFDLLPCFVQGLIIGVITVLGLIWIINIVDTYIKQKDEKMKQTIQDIMYQSLNVTSPKKGGGKRWLK